MRTTAIGLILLALVGSGAAFEAKTVLLRVDSPRLAHTESHVADYLEERLSRSHSLRVQVIPTEGEGEPTYPERDHDLDDLVAWGTELGGRYLLLVDIDREELEKRKGWVIPFLFHRWETFGVIEGEFRLIDLTRGRILKAEPFAIQRKAKAVFQGSVDDNPNDPDIKLSAREKTRFFATLEDGLAQQLIKQSTALNNGR